MVNTRIYDRAPIKDVRVKEPLVGRVRTPQILMSRHGGDYQKGDILDANTTAELIKDTHNPDIEDLQELINENKEIISKAVMKDTVGKANGVASLDSNGNVPTSLLGNIDTTLFRIVKELPTENIEDNKIYCVKDTTSEDELNVYIEYMHVNGEWEKVGLFKADPDLSGYMKLEGNSGDDIATSRPLINGGTINNAIIDSFVKGDNIINTEYDYGTLKLTPYSLAINNKKNNAYQFGSTSTTLARLFRIDSLAKLGSKNITTKLLLGYLASDLSSANEEEFGLRTITKVVDGNSKRTDAVALGLTFNFSEDLLVDTGEGSQIIAYSYNYPDGATSRNGSIASSSYLYTYKDTANIEVYTYTTSAYKRSKLNLINILSDYNNLLSKIEFKTISSVDIAIENSSNHKGIYINGLTSKDVLNANYGSIHVGADDDTTEYTSVAPIINGLIPSKYLNLSLYAEKASIPTKVSQLDNDSKYLTSYTETDPVWTSEKTNYYTKSDIDGKKFLTEHQSLVDYAKKTELPKNVSELTNDAKYITLELVPKTDLTDYAKKVDIPTVPTKISAFTNDAKYITLNDVPVVPVATKETLGTVKVGDGINVNDGVISIAPDYLVDMMSYGVEWDTTVADPTCTRIGNPLYHKSLPVQSQYKGCIVKDGKLVYFLDPDDWSMKADGITNAKLDGTDGDVMIRIPRFYGKSGSNGTKMWVRISTIRIDSSWVEIPEMYISAYRNTTYTDGSTTKTISVVSTDTKYRGGSRRTAYDDYLDTDVFRTDLGKPATSVNRATMRTYAKNAGQELLCYEFYKWIFYWAYVIEYANFNSLKDFNSELTSDGYHLGGLGSGLTTWDYTSWLNYNGVNPITPCGYTNEFGNFSGVKEISIPQTQVNDSTTVSAKTLYCNRWRGFENPFGDIWTNLDGIVLKRPLASYESKVYTTSDSAKFGDDISVMNIAGIEIAKDGWTKEYDLRETGEIIPASVGGNGSNYKCDYHWCNSESKDTRTLLVGGRAASGGSAGLGYFSSLNGVGVSSSYVGFRTVVRA